MFRRPVEPGEDAGERTGKSGTLSATTGSR